MDKHVGGGGGGGLEKGRMEEGRGIRGEGRG